MIVQLVGSASCPTCRELEAAVRRIMGEIGVAADIKKVTDPAGIMETGVVALPGLMIDGRVAASGRVPSAEELRRMLDADA